MRSGRAPDQEVRAWCAAHGHNGQPQELMTSKCAELGAINDAIPVDLDVLASAQGVRLPIEVVDMPQAGCTYVEGGRFSIRLRASDPPRRRRFTLAHEICHTFFESTRSRGVTDIEVGRHSGPGTVEHLCDLGAAELLLPAEAFRADCPPIPGFDEVAALAGTFDASLEATASRIVGLSLGPRQLVLLEPGLTVQQERVLARVASQPSFAGMQTPEPEPRLRVSWATGGDRFVPPNKSVDDGAALLRCIEDGDVDAVEDPGFTNGEVVRIVARYLPFKRDGVQVDRIMAFIYEP